MEQKPITINNNLLFSIVFVKGRNFMKSTHFWITLPCSTFEKKTAYRVSITPDTTFSLIFLVYFFLLF